MNKKLLFLMLLSLGFSSVLAENYTHYEWGCITDNGNTVAPSNTIRNGTNYNVSKYYSNGGNGLPSNCVGKQTKQNYTMTIDNNGGSGGDLKYNSDGSMYISNPSRTGYTFTSWSTSNGNAPASKIPASFAGNVTYTANWKINRYTISVNGDGGVSGIDGNGTYDYGSQACLTYRLKTGYKLSKVVGTGPDAGQTWTYDAGKTGNIVDCWNMVRDRAGTVYTEDITYYVSYDANGGSNAPSTQAFVFNSGSRISSSTPTRDGYDFVDWTYGGTHFNPGDAIPSGWGSFTLTANWKASLKDGSYNQGENVFYANNKSWDHENPKINSDGSYEQIFDIGRNAIITSLEASAITTNDRKPFYRIYASSDRYNWKELGNANLGNNNSLTMYFNDSGMYRYIKIYQNQPQFSSWDSKHNSNYDVCSFERFTVRYKYY